MTVETLVQGEIETPLGSFPALVSAQGVCCLALPPSPGWREAWLGRWSPRARLVRDDGALRPLADQLNAYLDGSRRDFDLPLDLRGTPFQLAVWRAMREIPFGQVRTYADVAAAVGRPRAVRAVGAACGANPVAPIVPCHRVVASGGRLGGYGGGLDLKRALLLQEGVAPASLPQARGMRHPSGHDSPARMVAARS